MPIIQGIDNAVVVVFGMGDIPIVVGNLEDHSEIGSIDLMLSKDCHPIGEVVPGTENMIGHPTSKLAPLGISPGIRLVFHKVESLDALIDSLRELKDIQGW